MDEHQLVNWRAVRDAADENALAFLDGSDNRATEARLLAALAEEPTRSDGLNGLHDVHTLRATQAADDFEWATAHLMAANHYAALLRRTELAVRETIAVITSGAAGSGDVAATTLLTLCERLGGRDGPDDASLDRGLRALAAAGAWQGVELVARAIFTAAERERLRWHSVLRRGLIAQWEMPDRRPVALHAMWHAAANPGTRAEITALLEGKALAALRSGDLDDLCEAQQLQHLVTGEPFAPWLQDQADRMYADQIDAAFPDPSVDVSTPPQVSR